MQTARSFTELGAAPRQGVALSEEVISGRRGHIILCGPPGGGKSISATMLAKAHFCLSHESDGSPCHRCSECVSFGENGSGMIDYMVVACGSNSRFEDLEPALEHMRVSPFMSKLRIVHFEEAHLLSARAQDALLTPMETKRPWDVVAIFTTSAENRLRPALRSRTREINVPPLVEAESVELLGSLCARQGIAFEYAGLSLLHRLKQGQIRGMLAEVDRLRTDGVYAATVRSAFGLEQIDTLDLWFKALVGSDLTGQIETLRSLRGDTREKLDLLHRGLAHVYLSKVEGAPAADPLFTHAQKDFGSCLVVTINRLAVQLKIDPEGVWCDIIKKFEPQDINDSGFDMLLAECNRYIKYAAQNSSGAAPKASSPRSARVRTRVGQQSGTGRGYGGVRDIVQAASFLTQQYGRLTNVAVTVSGRSEPKSWSHLISEAIRTLRQSVWYRERERICFDWISTHRWCSQSGRVETNIALSVSDDTSALLRARLPMAFERTLRRSAYDIDVDLRVPPDAHLRAAIAFHWSTIRRLIADVDPSVQTRAVAGEMCPLWSALRMSPADLVEPDPLKGVESWGRSESLGRKRQRKLASHDMNFLSAFDDGAWEWLDCGWELAEYNARLNEEAQRASHEEELRSGLRDGTELHHALLSDQLLRLRNMRPPDPRERTRPWRGWWVGGRPDGVRAYLHRVRPIHILLSR